MRITNNYLATIVMFGLVSTSCVAQDDDGPAGFSYATYHICDVATQGDMDTIIETNEKAVFDKWVKDGKLIAWGYLSWLYTDVWLIGWEADLDDPLQRAMEVARRSVELAPRGYMEAWLLSRVHFFRGELEAFQGRYQVSHEKVAIDRTLADDEVDLDSGFIIVPSAIPAPPEPTSTGETTPGDGGETGPPAVTPTGGETTGTDTGGTTAAEVQKTVRIRFHATRDQVFKAFPAIANLADKSNDGKVEIEVVGNNEEGFDQNWFRNAVEEPLDEADIERLQEEG